MIVQESLSQESLLGVIMSGSGLHEQFSVFFEDLPDPRPDRCKRHELRDIMLLGLLAILSGAESWTEVELFGRTHEETLRRVLKLSSGIPSHDTIGRVFGLLDAQKFQDGFVAWARSMLKTTGEEVIAIDGKSLRRSHDLSQGKGLLHLVSAYATQGGLTLGQVKTADHSNEITAIPELLKQLEIAGSTITLDAMGCQTVIVDRIRDSQADYVLALKGNQGTLHEDVVR